MPDTIVDEVTARLVADAGVMRGLPTLRGLRISWGLKVSSLPGMELGVEAAALTDMPSGRGRGGCSSSRVPAQDYRGMLHALPAVYNAEPKSWTASCGVVLCCSCLLRSKSSASSAASHRTCFSAQLRLAF